jgi:hypothetical protein
MINWIKNLFKKKEEPIDPLSINNWTISRTNNRVVYKIPVGNLSKEDAQKTLKELMNKYTMPISTNYWFPSPDYSDKIGKIERILNRIQPKEEN